LLCALTLSPPLLMMLHFGKTCGQVDEFLLAVRSVGRSQKRMSQAT